MDTLLNHAMTDTAPPSVIPGFDVDGNAMPENTVDTAPTSCPACDAPIYNDGDVDGLRVVQYACGRKQTKHPAKDYWMVFKSCPQSERVSIQLRAQVAALTAENDLFMQSLALRDQDVARLEAERDAAVVDAEKYLTLMQFDNELIEKFKSQRDEARAQVKALTSLRDELVPSIGTRFSMNLAPDKPTKQDIGYFEGWNDLRAKLVDALSAALSQSAAVARKESEK